MKNKSLLKVVITLSFCAFILMIIVNSLAVILPLNGKTTRELSDKYDNLFTPASVTFSIWGVIYLLLFMFIIYSIVKLIKKQYETISLSVYFWFIISCILNTLWIIMWHYEFVLFSLFVMIGLLLSLIRIYMVLHVKESTALFSKKLFIFLPFSIYLGWISVATIANVSVWLVSVGWNGFGISEIYWTMTVVFFASLLTLLFIFKYGDIFYAITVDWAFFGIVLKLLNVNAGNSANPYEINNKIIYFITIFIAFITIYAVIISLQKKIYKHQEAAK